MRFTTLLGMIFLSLGEAVVYDRSPKSSSDVCTERRCQETGPLADRLSKLALLPDFVSQTLLLLEDLMKEMDTELQRSASYLMDKVGPECSSTYHTLNEVLKKQRMREGRKSSPLGFGVEAVDSEVKTLLPDISDPYGEPDYEAPTTTKLRPKPVKVDSKYHQEPNGNKWQSGSNKWGQNTGSSSGHRNKWSRKEGSSDGFQASKPNKWKANHELSHDIQVSQDSGKWGDSKIYSSDGHSGGTSWQTAETSHYNQWDETGSNTQQYTDEQFEGSIEKYTDPSSTPKCHGIGKSSPFWVPGLDSWCVQNCAQGYCPSTHCIC